MNKLLIVDDSTALLDALKYILSRNGYVVKIMDTTDDIYKIVDEFQPDLVMLDIFLDGEDGRDICRELRQSARHRDLRILIFSSFPAEANDYKNYEADDFMAKPFELKNLMERIQSLLNLQPSSLI